MALQTFQDYLDSHGLHFEIVQTDGSTHTAQEAANEHGVPVSNIVKSLLVRADAKFILFLVPGDQRLDLEALKLKLGATSVRMANADEVKKVTGYSIGGVPPFGHKSKLKTFIQEGLTNETDLVAAAGAHNAVFKIPLSKLKAIVL